MTKRTIALLVVASAAALTAPALAEERFVYPEADQSGDELQPYLQCVPVARDLSGIAIYGNAHTWWDQAAGRYRRGSRPETGAVLAFIPHRGMKLGHVAAVSKVVDSRTVMLTHANWSPVNGRRGQIERNVKAVDVSPGNDWSEVRVWWGPSDSLGTTAWPAHGFIYNDEQDGISAPAPLQKPAVRIAGNGSRGKQVTPARAEGRQPSASFQSAFSDFGAPRRPVASHRAKRAESRTPARPTHVAPTQEPVDLVAQLVRR